MGRMAAMSIGLIGRKLGMTQVFQDDGTMVAVSILAIEPNTVTRLRTPDRDGYTAVQVGADGGRKLTKPQAGQLKDLPKDGARPATLREFRVESADDYSVGQVLAVADVFNAGDLVDVTGVSKGKGFAGHVKRHNFRRGPKTHGSDHHREPGSIGPGTTPGRVYKGLRMAGHMGDERTTIKKLRVVRTDPERNLLLVAGSLPGARGSLILVKKA
jgi:large subunit ribosomal protein L3